MITQSVLAWALLAAAGWGAALSVAGLGAGWISLGLIVWLAVALYPTDLIRPRGLGAWLLWAAWGLLAAFLCPEPLVAAAPAWGRAIGVLIFVLAYSWWGRPHRRAWLAAVWMGAAVFGIRAGLSGVWSPAAAGLVAAAAGSLLIARSEEMPERGWRAALLAMRFLVPLIILAGISGASKKRWDPYSAWGRSTALAAGVAASGAGPGRFAAASLSDGGPKWETSVSEWLETAVETGVPGTALLLIALLTVLLPTTFGPRPREWERRAAAGAAWGLAALSLGHGLFRYPELNLLWFTALACGAPGSEEEETRPFRLSGVAAWAGAAACLLAPAPNLILAAAQGAPASETVLEAAVEISPADPGLRFEQARRELQRRPAQWGRALALLDLARRAAPGRADYAQAEAEIFRAAGAEPEAAARRAAAAALRARE